MKAILSSTYDDKYLYFLPIVTWCWNRLGVDVICFMPDSKCIDVNMPDGEKKKIFADNKMNLIERTCKDFNLSFFTFSAPEHKEATYAQCSRLFGACLDLAADEILIVSDCDMANFKIPPYGNGVTIFGSDLVPEGQFPMCYASGTVSEWRTAFNLSYGTLSNEPNALMQYNVKPYQQCLDELLGEIDCEHMRGNYWGKDQQTLWEKTKDVATLIPRARPNTQFADNRVDRDDINWRAYVNEELVDAHLWREGFKEGNFENIMELLKMKYPQEDFTWLETYNSEYNKLI